MATRASIHGVGGVLFVVEFVLGVRGRGSGGWEWMRRVPGVLQKRVEGPRRARGVRASSACSSSSVSFHLAAWVRGEVDDREEGVGLGLALGDR